LASVTLEPKNVREKERVFQARLLNLSQQGVKLSVPQQLPLSETLRLRFTVQEFAMEFHVLARVCWSRQDAGGRWQAGCALNPGIPPALLKRMAAGGRLDRRGAARYDDSLELQVRRELDGGDEVAVLRNYSEGGFCIFVSQPAKPGELMHVRLDEPQLLVIVAQTQWQLKVSDGYLLGLTFLNSKDCERLEEACNFDDKAALAKS
jgi:hypothetical protein